MKRYLLRLFAIIFISSPLCYAQTDTLDRMVAVVNNGVILQSELDAAINKIKKQLRAENTALPPTDILQKQVLEQLVNKRLVLQLADIAGMNPTKEEVDTAVLSIAKSNHLSVPQLFEELQKRGISKAEYLRDIREEYIVQQVQQQAIASKINVTPQEVNDFMRSAAWLSSNNKEYHLEDILIALPEAPSTQDMKEAKLRADKLYDQLQKGLNFRDAAMAESGSRQALQGGDLGWRKLPEIPSAFATLILQAKESDILGPIQAPNGFHIIHLTGIRKAEKEKTLSPEAEQKRVQKLLFERKYEESLQAWLTKIRSEAFINTHPEAST